MKKLLILNIFLVIVSFNLISQTESGVSFDIVTNSGMTIYVNPVIPIDPSLITEYVWKFGDGTESGFRDPFPTGYTYSEPGTYKISFAVTYIKNDEDNTVIGTIPYEKYVTVPYTVSYGGSGGYPIYIATDPIEHTGPSHNMTYGPCSPYITFGKLSQFETGVFTLSDITFYPQVENVCSPFYSFKYYVDGVKHYNDNSSDRGIEDNSIEYLFGIETGFHKLQLNIIKQPGATSVEWSDSYEFYVRPRYSALQCMPTKHAKASFYHAPAIIQEGTNANVIIQVEDISSSAPGGINRTSSNWTHHITTLVGGNRESLGIIGSVVSTLPGHISLKINTSVLSPGVYAISDIMVDGNDPTDCVNCDPLEAIAVIQVEPTLLLDKEDKIKSLSNTSPDYTKYSLTIDSKANNYSIDISGPLNCDGTISVEGDWIEVLKFNNTLLEISCEANTGEAREGSIVFKFPEISKEVTLNIHQTGETFEVSNSTELKIAINEAPDGGTIVLNEGIYNAPLKIIGKNITLASKFLETGDPYYIDNTIIDANNEGSVVKLVGDGSFEGTTRIVGMHLTGGNSEEGGGIYCSSANLDLEHVLIHSNYGDKGGGIYASNAVINANHITLTGNESDADPSGVALNRKYGHMIYIRDNSSITLSNSIIGSSVDKQHGGIYYDVVPGDFPYPEIKLNYSRVEGTSIFAISNDYTYYSATVWIPFHYGNYVKDFKVSQDWEIDFEDPGNQNYWLGLDSRYKNAADDKKDLGALFRTVPYKGTDVVSANPESVDFGNIIAGKTITKEIEITNLIDYKVIASPRNALYEIDEYGYKKPLDADDFSVIPSKMTLEKGETKKIYVTFNPETFGSKKGRIDVYTKSSRYPLEIPLNGESVTKPDLEGYTSGEKVEICGGRYLWGHGFSYYVKNIGGTASTPCKVRYYLSQNHFSINNAKLLAEQNLPSFAPHSINSVLKPDLIAISSETPISRYYLISVLDPENEIDEHNENNNWTIQELNIIDGGKPALTVENIKVLEAPYLTQYGLPYVFPGSKLLLNFDVHNSIAEKLDYNLKIYLSEDGNYDEGDVEVFSTKHEGIIGSVTHGMYFTIPEDCNKQSYSLLFRAYEEAIPENDPNIKTAWMSFVMFTPPDYYIGWSEESLNPTYAGENYFTSTALWNHSLGGGPAVDIKYFLSSDQNYDENDIELGVIKSQDFKLFDRVERLEKVVTIPKATPPGTYYIVMEVDPDNVVEETNETNNTYSVKIQVINRPDLLMHPITLSANNVMAGNSITASTSVSNIDYGVAPESKLKFYLSANDYLDNSWDPLLAEVTVPSLEKDESFAVNDIELTIPFESGGGDWYVYAKIDGDVACPNKWCDIKESDEDNNIVNSQISVWRQPDLYFGTLSLRKDNAIIGSFLEGSEIDLFYGVFHSNGNMNTIGGHKGLSYAGDHTLRTYLSNDAILDIETDTRLSSIILGSSEGNTWQNGILPITLPENLEGEQWYVFAVIDVNEQVDERDETNNTWMQEITITEKPDLEIQSFNVEPAIAIQGITNTLNFSSFVKNISPMNKINYASVSYYFSADNLLSPDDKFVYSVSGNLSDDLNNEATMPDYGDNWESSAWSQGIVHGQYHLIAKALPATGTIESNLENNVVAIPFEIVQPTDLEIVNLSLDRTTIQEGSDFTVTCTVRNNNATTTVPTHLLFSFDPWKDFSNSSFSHTFESVEIKSLAQGETIDITRTYTAPEGKTAYYFHAICDINNANLEADKNNNRVNVPISIQRVYPPLQIAVAITSPTSNGGNDGEIRCNVTGGDGNYSYKWYKGGVEAGEGIWLNNVEAGEYFVEVKDLSGNSGSESFVVTEPQALASTAIVAQHVSTHNGSDGVIEVEILNGNPPYQISFSGGYSEMWPVGQTAGSISGLASGWHNITISDANTAVSGITNSHSVYINNVLDVAYSFENVSKYGANNGSIHIINVNGAVAPVTYAWSKNGEEISTESNINNLSPGTYILQVKDNTGNTKIETVTITEPNELIVEYTVTDVSITGQSDGAIDLTVVSGNPPYTFQWQNGNTNEDVSNWPAGIHSVVITDAFHSITKNIRIGQPFTITATSHVNVTTHGGSNGSLQCSVTGGYTPYQYTWMKNGEAYATGVASLNNISAGIYELMVEDAQGNTVSETFNVTEPNPIEGAISLLNHPSTFGGSDGVIEINITNGNPPYTILSYGNVLETWTNGKTSGTITGLSHGGHYIEVRDSKSQTSGDAMVQMIDMFNPINIEPNVTHVRHYGENNGNISLSISCGRPIVSCEWLRDGSSYIPTGSLERTHPYAYSYSFIEPNLATGIYTATVTDDIGRTNSMDIKVAQPNELIVESHITNVSLAGGNNGRIDLEIKSGNSPYTFNWSKQGTTGYISHNEDITGLSTGVYQLRVVDNANQYFDQTINVQEPIKINFAIEGVKTPGGSQGKISANATSGVGPYTHEWTLNGTPFADNTQSLESLSAGEYTVTITDKTGSVGTETITLSDPEPLTISFDVTDVSSFNGNDGAVDLTVSGGIPPYTFSWDGNGSGYSNNLEDINGLAPGTYRVFVSDGYTTVYSTNIVRNPLTLHGGNKTNNTATNGAEGIINSRCDGGYSPITADIYKDGIFYVSYNDLPEGNLLSLNSLSSGEYLFVYTDAKNTTATRVFNITDPVSIEFITAQLSGPVDDAQITVEISGGLPPYTFNWRKDNVFYSNEKDLNDLSDGVYGLTVTDSEGRTASGIEVINVFLPSVTVSGGGTVCENEGEAIIAFDLTGTPPWRIDLTDGTNYFQIANINETPYHYTTSNPGTYRVTNGRDSRYFFNKINGSATVEIANRPTATISGGGTLCANTEGVPVSIDFTGEAPWSVTYTNGTLTYLFEDITESHYEFVTDLPGTYTITSVSDANCTGTGTGAAEIIALPAPTAHITGGKGICNNQDSALVNIVLSGTAPWDITYSDGANSYAVNGITEPLYEIVTNVPGIYSVTQVNDATGCPGYSANTLEVGNHQLPTANLSGSSVCENQQANLNFALTGYAPWTITYTDGTNSSEIIAWGSNFELPVSSEGTYQVTAISDNFCDGTDLGAPTDVIINPSPTVSLGQDANICEGNSLTLDAGSGFQSYNWNGQPGESQFNISTAGTYIVEVTDVNGCTATDEIEVSVNPLPIVSLGPDITATSDAFIYLEAEPGYQSYEWSGNNNCQILCVSMQNVSTYADVWLNVTDDNGCVGSDQIRLNLATQSQALISNEESVNKSVPNITFSNFDVDKEDVVNEENIESVSYKLFPNPTTGKLSILISDPSKVKSIKVYNLNGNLIKTFDYISNNQVELDLTNYAKGVYLIRAKEEKTIKEFKIIRN